MPPTDFEMHVLKTLGEIKESQGRTEQSLTDLRGELLGPEGRVTRVEQQVASDKKWQRYYNYIVVPALAIGHGIARKLGVQV
jgi:hypothetical protein